VSAAYRAVADFDAAALASLLVSRLEDAGFHPAPVAESAHVQLAGVDRTFTVEVPAAERDAVIEFLHENGYGKHVRD
jgi:hypothetical protein